jgi:hypothetical protein
MAVIGVGGGHRKAQFDFAPDRRLHMVDTVKAMVLRTREKIKHPFVFM